MGVYDEQYGILKYGNDNLNKVLPTLQYFIGSKVPHHGVNLAYVSTPSANSRDFVRVINELNINMSHISNYDSYFPTDEEGAIQGTITGFSDYCILTDKFYYDPSSWTSTNKYEVLSQALWYRYHLRAYSQDRLGLLPGLTLQSNIKVVGPTGEVLNDPSYLYDIYIDKVISDGVYDCSVWTNFQDRGYKVQYCPISSSLEHEETLNPMPLFFQGDTAQGLSYSASNDGMNYTITCNYKFTPNSYVAVKFPADHFLETIIPPYNDRDDNWYLKIGRGQIYAKHLIFRNHLYYTQNFVKNHMPAIQIIDDPCTIVTSNKIQTTYFPILNGYYDQNTIFSLVVRVNDEDYYSIMPPDKEDFSGILDIDNQTGIITLPIDLQEGDVIRVRYYIWELYYTYRGYTNTGGRYVHLDVNPNFGHYIVKDPVSGSYCPSNTIVGQPINIYINPDMATVAPTVNLYHTFSDSPNTTGTPYKLNKTLNLAFVNIAEYVYEPVIMDARSPGGGLKENLEPNSDSQQFWDIGSWEGLPYQSNGSFVVDINNGQFTKEFIQDIIDKYKAAGTLGLMTSRTGQPMAVTGG